MGALDGEFVRCGDEWQAGEASDLARRCLGKPRRGVDSRSDRRAHECQAVHTIERRVDPLDIIRRSDYRTIELNRGQIVFDSAEAARAAIERFAE